MNGDENEWDTPEDRKAFYRESDEYREQHRAETILAALKTEGFCLAFLPPVRPPAHVQRDFTHYLPSLNGIPNLVVAAPHLTLEFVKKTIDELPQRHFGDGTTIEEINKDGYNYNPATNILFSFQTEIIYVAGIAANPPYAQGDLNPVPWAHCVELKIKGAGPGRQLRVIHIGLPGRDQLYLNFLIPHGLLPTRLLR